jgi:hypothetical protein
MSWMPLRKGRFLLRYAVRDLFEWHAAKSTSLVLANLAGIAFFALLIFGLAEGYERVRLHRLQQDFLTLCLPVGNRNIVEQEFTPEKLKELETALEKKLEWAPEGGLLKIFPFLEMDLPWKQVKGKGASTYSGRTVKAEDLVLQSRKGLLGRALTYPSDKQGVWVSAALLKYLGGDPKNPPPTLSVLRIASGNLCELPLLDVLDQPLPQGHEFLITEESFESIVTDPDKRVTEIRTGPVPDGWPDTDELPQPLKDKLQKENIEGPSPTRKAGKTVWRFQAADLLNGLRLSQWTATLNGIYDRLVNECKLPDGPSFKEFEVLDEIEEKPINMNPSRVGIYVKDVLYLKDAASVAKDLGYDYPEDTIAQIESIRQSSTIIQLVLAAIVAAVAFLAAWNTWVILHLRTQQKIPEVGMLKAMGMGNAMLRSLYLTEGFVLWLIGVPLGVGLGWLAGQWVERLIPEDAQGPTIEFYCPWYGVAVIIGVALVVILITTLWASWHARRAPPMESLSSG